MAGKYIESLRLLDPFRIEGMKIEGEAAAMASFVLHKDIACSIREAEILHRDRDQRCLGTNQDTPPSPAAFIRVHSQFNHGTSVHSNGPIIRAPLP